MRSLRPRSRRPRSGSTSRRRSALPACPTPTRGPAAWPSSTILRRAASSTRPSPHRWVAAVAAVVGAASVGGLLGFALGDSSDDADIGSLAQQALDEPNGVLATLADSDGRPVARVVADEDGAFMLLDALQDLPEGRAYQLWSVGGPEPVSLGMLGRDGTNTVAFRLPPTISELAISVAPTSGDSAPSGEFRASGSVLQ